MNTSDNAAAHAAATSANALPDSELLRLLRSRGSTHHYKSDPLPDT